MIQVKLYLYDSAQERNEYRGADLSAYIFSGAQNTENLTEELDVSELTLQGYPERAEFAPETKFILDIYEDEMLRYTYHRVVQEDVVEQPILSDEQYFTHTITLIEPSAIAQKRIVDDIAVSYKLKDVELKKVPAFTLEREVETTSSATPPYIIYDGFGFCKKEEELSAFALYNARLVYFGKYFKWRTATNANDKKVHILYTNTSNESVRTENFYVDLNDIKTVSDRKYVQLELPVPAIMWGKPDNDNFPPTMKGYAQIGYASFVCEVTETDVAGNSNVILSQTFRSSSALNGQQDAPTDFPYSQFVNSYTYANFRDEYLPEYVSVVGRPSAIGCSYYFSKFTDLQNGTDFSNANNRPITNVFEVKTDCTYNVSLKVKSLNENEDYNSLIDYKDEVLSAIDLIDARATFYDFTDENYRGYSKVVYGYEKRWFIITSTITTVAENYPDTADNLPENNFNARSQFFCYSSSSGTIMLQSAFPYTALNLVKKAIANSYLYQKIDGVGADDFSANSPYPFYISSKAGENLVTESELSATRINEAFYHQKNLWEILLEAGKYCHAIPQIEFGTNDRFAISFYKLGTTNQKTTQATKMSVMNFRKIDDYISACSSYVDNLVQLGGTITEIVPAKTTSEDFTISNDTACITVSKPIIEIIKINAIATENTTIDYYDKDGLHYTGTIVAGTKKDITSYIYEKSVYNLLSVRYDEKPNKGIALYYELGDNNVVGGDYQLPQPVTNPYSDYAFKKVLYCGMTESYPANLKTSGATPSQNDPWYNIKVNTFIFEVTYRTKDTARVESTRPDLRHYLLSSSKDEVPQHRQFNNQQDILVDSTAFGANMFGKLIRTGNSNYKMREWCNRTNEIKHKGELFVIDGQWYYVAKVTNIFFPDHIESIVEYSKDYNQLSEIIGIPSEPRFYEISERSRIDREVQIGDYFIITTDQSKVKHNHQDFQRFYYIMSGIIFGGVKTPYMKWAWTTFKGDPNIIDVNTFGDKTFEKTVISPVNSYLCGNTLTFEWDMEDNFSAGNAADEIPNADFAADDAYVVMRAVQYCDKFGKAALFDVKLSHNSPVFYPYGSEGSFVYDATQAKEVRVLPNAELTEVRNDETVVTPITPLYNFADITYNNMILLKDSREAIHLNYNLMTITDSDRFILSPFLLEEKDTYYDTTESVAAFLTEEVSKFTDGYILKSNILQIRVAMWSYTYGDPSFPVYIEVPNGIDMTRVKAIALYLHDSNYNPPYSDKIKFLVARNVTGENIQNGSTLTWYFGAPNKDAIWNAQNGNKQ